MCGFRWTRRRRRAVDDRDAALGEVAAQHRLEADLVPRLGVGDVELPRAVRAHRHVEEDRADAGHAPPCWRRRVGVGVDQEDVLVGQGEGDLRAPVARELVLPSAVAGLNLTMRPVSGAVGRRARRDSAAGRRWPRRRVSVMRRRAVAGMEDRRVDGVAVGLGERARRVAEERQDRRAACRRARRRATSPRTPRRRRGRCPRS